MAAGENNLVLHYNVYLASLHSKLTFTYTPGTAAAVPIV